MNQPSPRTNESSLTSAMESPISQQTGKSIVVTLVTSIDQKNNFHRRLEAERKNNGASGFSRFVFSLYTRAFNLGCSRILDLQCWLVAGREMAPRNSNDCAWVGGEQVGGEQGHWLLEHSVKITSVELRTKFPVFFFAVQKMCEHTEDNLVTFDDLETLFGLSGLALTELTPRRQRYQLYRAVACFFG
ncbi:hypothetical protein R1sor_016842 [Riccia sorocarpa]|uniref:Uncharacterized protein n=1 Tax=Riccia sorocarpa TaxID=122646 RepID=A0ABD3HGL1_9MARC